MKNLIKLGTALAMMAVILMSFVASASEPIKMCDEKNSWVYFSSDAVMENERGQGLSFMKFVGEKEVNGHVYNEFKTVRTIFSSASGSKEYEESKYDGWFFRQDSDKIWLYSSDVNDCDYLMYDFGTLTGQPMPGLGIDHRDLRECCETIVWPDTIIGGFSRKVYAARIPSTGYVPEVRCIEGIGTTNGFMPSIDIGDLASAGPDYMSTSHPGYRCHLVAVYNDSGNFIYGDKASYDALVNRLSGIGDIIADDNADNAVPVYYNLQGQRIAAPQKGQPCIELQGGKARKFMAE